jgi:hypothetical protein
LRSGNRDDTVGALNGRVDIDRRGSPRKGFVIMKHLIDIAAAAMATTVLLSGPAFGQDRHDPHGREQASAHAPHLQLDPRYHHDHYYPPRGYVTTALPGAASASPSAGEITTITPASGSGPSAAGSW